MLKRKSQNAYATIVALFQNAVPEITTEADMLAVTKTEMERLRTFLPLDPLVILKGDRTNPDFLNFMEAGTYFGDFDLLFGRYMQRLDLANVAMKAGLKMKRKHTIIQPWPLRLNKNPTQEEFDELNASGHVGHERYVEWESRD